MTIKQLRTKKQMTQQQVADAIGVDVATYNRYERGKYAVSKTIRVALSAVFGTEPDQTDSIRSV